MAEEQAPTPQFCTHCRALLLPRTRSKKRLACCAKCLHINPRVSALEKFIAARLEAEGHFDKYLAAQSEGENSIANGHFKKYFAIRPTAVEEDSLAEGQGRQGLFDEEALEKRKLEEGEFKCSIYGGMQKLQVHSAVEHLEEVPREELKSHWDAKPEPEWKTELVKAGYCILCMGRKWSACSKDATEWNAFLEGLAESAARRAQGQDLDDLDSLDVPDKDGFCGTCASDPICDCDTGWTGMKMLRKKYQDWVYPSQDVSSRLFGFDKSIRDIIYHRGERSKFEEQFLLAEAAKKKKGGRPRNTLEELWAHPPHVNIGYRNTKIVIPPTRPCGGFL